MYKIIAVYRECVNTIHISDRMRAIDYAKCLKALNNISIALIDIVNNEHIAI